MLPGLLAGGTLALLGLFPALALTWHQPPEVVAAANQIYVFDRLPHHLAPLSLPMEELAQKIMLPFVGDCLTPERLLELCEKAYGRFAHAAVVPLKQLDETQWVLELFHGPTLAFKDVALQLLGLLFEEFLARGDDHLTNAARQIVIYNAMGWAVPVSRGTIFTGAPSCEKAAPKTRTMQAASAAPRTVRARIRR